MAATGTILRKKPKKVVKISELPPEVRGKILQRKRRTTLFSTIVMVLGIALISYPFVAGWWNAMHQTEQIDNYIDAGQGLDPEPYFQAAREYNAQLDTLVMTDPYASVNSDNSDPYWKALKIPNTDVMARVTLPSIKVDLPVFHGTSESTLRRGAGHLYGSSLPVGGPGTHTVISAHSGMPEARMFDNLHKLKKGDVFVITVLGEQLLYEVERIQVIKPEDGNKALIMEPGRDLATLVTCTPYGVNSHRLLVTGHRIPGNAEDNNIDMSRSGIVETLWWLLPLIGAVAGASGFGIMQYRRLKGAAPNTDNTDEQGNDQDHQGTDIDNLGQNVVFYEDDEASIVSVISPPTSQ